MTTIWKRGAMTSLAGLLLGLAVAIPAFAHDEIDRECVAKCKESAKDCAFDAREAGRECMEEAGCDVLRDAYRDVCLVADRDEAACTAARDELRSCVAPCRELVQELREQCREEFNECLAAECGIDDPPGRRQGRFRHPRACYEACLEQGGEDTACREDCAPRRRPRRGPGNHGEGPLFR